MAEEVLRKGEHVHSTMARAGAVAGSVVSWGTAVTLAVVDIVTDYELPRWTILIPLAVAVTISGSYLAARLVSQRIDEIVREASAVEAYRLALATVTETLRSRRPDDSGELPRVVGDDYIGDGPTHPIRRRPQLIQPINGQRPR